MARGRAGVAHLCGPRFLNAPSKLSAADLKAALADEARALGFDCVGVTGPDVLADAGQHFRDFLEAGAHGDMDWLAAHPERRTDPRGLWRDVRSIVMLGVNYGPDENPLVILERRTRGAISVYAQGDDYHDLIKKRLKTLARWLVATIRLRGQGVRRYRRRDGKAPGAGRGPRLAGQAHQPRLARVRLMAVSRRDLHHAGSAARRGRRRPLRLLPRLPRHLSDGGVSRALQARREALHFLSHHREQGSNPAGIPQSRSATASMAATIASRYARGTNSRRQAAKRNSPRAKICAPPNSPSWPGSTTPRFAPCSRNRRSSASAATASSATC